MAIEREDIQIGDMLGMAIFDNVVTSPQDPGLEIKVSGVVLDHEAKVRYEIVVNPSDCEKDEVKGYPPDIAKLLTLKDGRKCIVYSIADQANVPLPEFLKEWLSEQSEEQGISLLDSMRAAMSNTREEQARRVALMLEAHVATGESSPAEADRRMWEEAGRIGLQVKKAAVGAVTENLDELPPDYFERYSNDLLKGLIEYYTTLAAASASRNSDLSPPRP